MQAVGLRKEEEEEERGAEEAMPWLALKKMSVCCACVVLGRGAIL